MWSLMLVMALLLLMLIPLIPAFTELYLKQDAEPVRIGKFSYLDIDSYSRGFENFLKNKFKGLIGPDCSFIEPENKEGTFNNQPYLYLKKPVARQELVSDIEKNMLFTTRMILSEPDIELPSNMLYESEVFAKGSLATGRNNYLKAAMAHGDVFVQPNTEVLRWISSRGTLSAHGPATFHGRLSAAQKIIADNNILFKWMAAPEIITNPSETVSTIAADYRESISYNDTPITELEHIDLIEILGNVAFIRGNLAPPPNWRSSLDIIATGNITLMENTILSGKVKANGDLITGHHCKLMQSVVSSKNILIREGSFVKGPLLAEDIIEIIAATVGEPEQPSSIYAREVSLIGSCKVFGSIYAEDKGEVRKI